MIYVLLLTILAVIDSVFAGFRESAGSNPLLHKNNYFRLAMFKGGLVGVGVVCVIALTGAGHLIIVDSPAEIWTEYLKMFERMVQVYGVFATTVLTALFLYASPRPEVSSLVTVIVLGPFTLMRPVVILFGILWGLSDTTLSPGVVLFGLVTLGLMVNLERLIAWLNLNPKALDDQIRLR